MVARSCEFESHPAHSKFKQLSSCFFCTCMQKSPEQIEFSRLQNRLTKRFHKGCADYGLIADGDHILVGLSGGKDSLALVEFLGRRSRIYVPHFRVTAVHVRVTNIGYQSDVDYLRAFCAEQGVDFLVRDTEYTPRDEEKNTCFLCSWYRRKALFAVAQELGCNKIALGHHKDDIVETLLMNLIFKGAFCAIPPMLQMEKMPLRLIRPLCLCDERDLNRYAELAGYRRVPKLCPFERESNRARVKQLVRDLESFNPNVRESIFAASENIQTLYLPHKL